MPKDQEHQQSAALAGLRVVDFGQYVSGPLVAQMLADFGADVVRIDPPGGPVWRGDGNALLQRGKRSIVLDLKQEGDLDVARRLVERADIVVENFRPGVMDRLGLGWEAMQAINPRLVYSSIPGFASDDPRSTSYATEGVVASAAGLYPTLDFKAEGEPVVNTLQLASIMAAMMSSHGIAAALIARERCGRGQRIEVSMFDAAFEVIRFYTDAPPQENRRRVQLGGTMQIAIARSYECSDGKFVRVSWLEKRQLETFAKFVGLYDQWKERGFFELGVHRSVEDAALSDALAREAAAVFITQPAEYWEKTIGAQADLIAIRTSDEFLVFDEHAREIGASVRLVDPELGVTYQGGVPVNLTRTPGLPKARHSLDADRDTILAELDQPTEKAEPNGDVADVSAALEGFKVVDMTVLLAGPGLGRLLAEYGAEVVHVGRPNWNGMRFHYQVHIGKKTMLLDLKRPEAREIFEKIVADADIVSTNFSQSVARRLGVDDASVRQVAPDIIYSRISAHGAWGPREEFRGHEEVGQAVTGALTRFSKDRAGNMQLFALNDSATGHVAAFGIMLGLYHRMKGGGGQFVGASLAQTALLWQSPYMVAHANHTWRDDAGGLDYRGDGPLDHAYRAGDGRWIYLAAKGERGLAELSAVEGFAGIGSAPAAQQGLEGGDILDPDQLQGEIAGRVAREPAQTWVDRISGYSNLAAVVISTVDEPMNDPWARAHGLASEVDFPRAGIGLQVGPAKRLSMTPMRLGIPVGPPGSDTEDVLAGIGLAEATEGFIASGVVQSELGELTPP